MGFRHVYRLWSLARGVVWAVFLLSAPTAGHSNEALWALLRTPYGSRSVNVPQPAI
jgi:hypothetical protein